MKESISKQLSNTLMIANLIATLLVILIHYRSNISLTNGYDYNYFLQEFLAGGLAKISVPFFALVSGFFLKEKLNGLNSYFKLLEIKFKTLVIPYIATSLIIFISLQVLKIISKNQVHDSFELSNVCYRIFIHPVSMQFWFLRDLIILIFVSPLLLKLPKVINFISLGVLLLFWFMDFQFFPKFGGWYLISIDTIFFFCLGGMLKSYNFLDKVIQFKNTTKVILLVSWMLLNFIRVLMNPDFDLWYASNYTLVSLILHKLAILLGIISLIQISSWFYQSEKLIYLSGLTFFSYLFHLVPLSYFKTLTSKVISSDFSFYINYPLSVFLVFFLAHVASKYFNQFYMFITGGRNPKKVLNRMTEFK
jgi:hypothetical protein